MILVYSKDSCPYCDMAKRLLSEKAFVWKEQKIGRDIQMEEFSSMFPNQRTVPLIMVTEEGDGFTNKIGGYEDLVEYIKNTEALQGMSL
jgi:glutaredoxin